MKSHYGASHTGSDRSYVKNEEKLIWQVDAALGRWAKKLILDAISGLFNLHLWANYDEWRTNHDNSNMFGWRPETRSWPDRFKRKIKSPVQPWGDPNTSVKYLLVLLPLSLSSLRTPPGAEQPGGSCQPSQAAKRRARGQRLIPETEHRLGNSRARRRACRSRTLSMHPWQEEEREGGGKDRKEERRELDWRRGRRREEREDIGEINWEGR